MPVDTHQVANVALSDTFSTWKDKTNDLIKLVNELPGATSAAITRLGGTIDGDSGAQLTGTQGTLYLISSGKIALGDFLGTSQQTSANVQSKLHMHSEAGNAVMYLTQNTASKVSAIVFGRRAHNNLATNPYGSSAGVIGMVSNASLSETGVTHSKLIFAANSYVDTGHASHGGEGFLSAQQNWWGQNYTAGIRFVLDSGEAGKADMGDLSGLMYGGAQARLNAPMIIWKKKWDDPNIANNTPLMTLVGQSQQVTGASVDVNTPIVLRFQDTSVATRNVATTYSNQNRIVTAPFAAIDFGGIDDTDATYKETASARISSSALGSDGRSASIDFWVRTRDLNGYYTDDYYPEMGDGPKLINVMRIVGDSAWGSGQNVGKVIISANTNITANAAWTNITDIADYHTYPGQLNIVPGAVNRGDLKANGSAYNSGLFLSAQPQNHRGSSEGTARTRDVPARIMFSDPNANTNQKNTSLEYSHAITTSGVPYINFKVQRWTDSLNSRGNTFFSYIAYDNTDHLSGNSNNGRWPSYFTLGVAHSDSNPRHILSVAGGGTMDTAGGEIIAYTATKGRGTFNSSDYDDTVDMWKLQNVTSSGYSQFRIWAAGNTSMANSMNYGPTWHGSALVLHKKANQNTHVGIGLNLPDSELHIQRTPDMFAHHGVAPDAEYNANVHIEATRAVQLWLEADNQGVNPTSYKDDDGSTWTYKGFAAHPEIRLTQDALRTDTSIMQGAVNLDWASGELRPSTDSVNDFVIAHHGNGGNVHFALSTEATGHATTRKYVTRLSIHKDGRMSFGNSAVAGITGGAGSSGPIAVGVFGATGDVTPAYEFNTSSMQSTTNNWEETSRGAYNDFLMIRGGRAAGSTARRRVGILLSTSSGPESGSYTDTRGGQVHSRMTGAIAMESSAALADYPSMSFYPAGGGVATAPSISIEATGNDSDGFWDYGCIGLLTQGAGVGKHAGQGAALVSNVVAFVGSNRTIFSDNREGLVVSGPGASARFNAKGALTFAGISDAVTFQLATAGDTATSRPEASGDHKGPSISLVQGMQPIATNRGHSFGREVATHLSVHSGATDTTDTHSTNSIALGSDWWTGIYNSGSDGQSRTDYRESGTFPGAVSKLHLHSANSTYDITQDHGALPAKTTHNGGAIFMTGSWQTVALESTKGAAVTNDGVSSTTFGARSSTNVWPDRGLYLTPTIHFGAGGVSGETNADRHDASYGIVGSIGAGAPPNMHMYGTVALDTILRGHADGRILIGTGGGDSVDGNSYKINRSGYQLKIEGGDSSQVSVGSTGSQATKLERKGLITANGSIAIEPNTGWLQANNAALMWARIHCERDATDVTSTGVGGGAPILNQVDGTRSGFNVGNIEDYGLGAFWIEFQRPAVSNNYCVVATSRTRIRTYGADATDLHEPQPKTRNHTSSGEVPGNEAPTVAQANSSGVHVFCTSSDDAPDDSSPDYVNDPTDPFELHVVAIGLLQ
tara:strand:- start:9045 stop:13466 length:4422 start_codon:yes stop_codon:yes gene_type:complete